MVADSQGRHAYYHCSGNVDHVSTSMPRRCPAPLVYAPDLDRLVWKEMTSLLSSPETMLEAYKQQQGKNGLRGPDVLEAELQRLDERVGDVERQIQRLLDGYQSGFIYPSELARRRAALEEKSARWTQQREQLEAERPKWREAKEVSENLSLFCQHVVSGLGRFSFEDKQRLLRKLVERVYITAWQVKVKLTIPLSTKSDLTPLGFYHSKAIRGLFERERRLLGLLSRTAYEAVRRSFQALFARRDVRPGCVISIQTFGSHGANFNPHCHAIISDGVWSAEGEFLELPSLDTAAVCELFRRLLLRRLHKEERLSERFMENLLSWVHPGFSVFAGEPLSPEDAGQLERLARYVTRPPLAADSIRRTNNGMLEI